MIYQLRDDSTLELTIEVQSAHEMLGEAMPVWIVAVDPMQQNLIVSGGDDMMMRLWDLRDTTRPVAISRDHEAGVTTAMFHPHNDHMLATGSYDSKLRVWDTRSLRLPVNTIPTGSCYSLRSAGTY